MSIDYTGIKHAYIGATNLKKIYQGGTLQWEEPSSEPKSVFRVIRATEDDTWSVGDGLAILMRNPQDGLYRILTEFNSSIGGIKYIMYSDTGINLRYDYNVIGSDGKRLCYYFRYTDQDYTPYTVADTALGGKYAKIQRRMYSSSERYLQNSTTLNRNLLSWASSGKYFGREANTGYYERDIPDIQNIDSPWFQNIANFSPPNQYSISPSAYTYGSVKYVAWVKTLETGVYMFKKVTAYL